MKSKIFFISLFIGLIFSSVASAELNLSSVQTLHQVPEFSGSTITIPSNGSFVAAIKIYDVDINNINYINVSSSTYSMNLTLIKNYLSVDVTTNFHDKVSNRYQTKTFKNYITYAPYSIELPNYGFADLPNIPSYTLTGVGIPGISGTYIQADFSYWYGSSVLSVSSVKLINSPVNMSNFVLILPSKTVSVKITGGDKVDIDYLLGTEQEVTNAIITYNSTGSDVTQEHSWFTWIAQNIPFIGKYLDDGKGNGFIPFLSKLFSIVYSLLIFIIFDLDILFLMVLSFAELHGIIIMAAGGTPFDGVNHPVRDILFTFKQTYNVLVSFFMLIWKIIQAIATFLPW